MAELIDEYKQAIQDVLDGRAKPAPKPSELPWTEDKAATMWAAAAAELIAEAAIPEPGADLPDTPGTDGTYVLQNAVESGEGTLSWASGGGGGDSSVVIIPVTYANFHLHLDASFNDILGYLAAGKVIFATLDGTQGAGVGQWTFANTATGPSSYVANFISYSTGVSVTSFSATSATENLSA